MLDNWAQKTSNILAKNVFTQKGTRPFAIFEMIPEMLIEILTLMFLFKSTFLILHDDVA